MWSLDRRLHSALTWLGRWAVALDTMASVLSSPWVKFFQERSSAVDQSQVSGEKLDARILRLQNSELIEKCRVVHAGSQVKEHSYRSLINLRSWHKGADLHRRVLCTIRTDPIIYAPDSTISYLN
jgi:hypothetical protein